MICKTVLLVLFCIASQKLVKGHSWMSCPRPFDTYPDKAGDTTGPCEKWYKGATTDVLAGDRLKVGWTSNNHGGGYVRLALVPESQKDSHEAYLNNVLKVVCYGHDQRPGMFRFGDCKHPCNARPGCQYQSDVLDNERYDTTITIPFNLADGIYILQYKAAIGIELKPYYNCAKLRVTGGDPSLDCTTDKAPPVGPCRLGPPGAGLPLSNLTKDAKLGDFCFHPDKVGAIDDRIREVPINVDCDPRITCQVSVSPAVCKHELGMDKIADAWDPKQPNCGVVKPPPPPTCDDGVQNQGEHAIDCGGPNCKACPDVADTGYEEYIEHIIDNEWCSGYVVTVLAKIKRFMNGNWQVTIFYDYPLEIVSHWNAVLVSHNKFKTIYSFQGFAWNQYLQNGDFIEFAFEGHFTEQRSTPKTLLLECYQCQSSPSSLRAFALKPKTCESLDCPSGFQCEERRKSPCTEYPCTQARCIPSSLK